MQQPQQPEKILRWVKASKWPAKLTGERIGKTNHKRHVLVTILKNGTADWRNREYEDEKVEFILLESAEDLSAPASPVPNQGQAYLLLKNLVDTDMALSQLYNQGVMSGSAFIQAEHDLGMAKQNAQEFLDSSPVASPVEESPEEDPLWIKYNMPQTENPQASYWFEKARQNLVDRNDFKAQLSRANDKIKELTESKPSLVIEIGEDKYQMPLRMPESVQNALEGKIRPYHNPLSFKSGAVELWEYLAQLPNNTQYDASHPAPAPIVGEREERKYPIGGYAPGNYHCNCVTCKEKFQGDKRAVQCEPCAIKMVEDSGGKDYAHIHVSLPNGATATVSPDTSPELLNALTKMVDLAKAMSDAPTEQALPEDVDREKEKLSWEIVALTERLSAANALIKEKQEWINSHL